MNRKRLGHQIAEFRRGYQGQSGKDRFRGSGRLDEQRRKYCVRMEEPAFLVNDAEPPGGTTTVRTKGAF